MHEILILFVIAVIVGFQVKIFLEATKKIDLFKAIIPDASNFETVKVFIPESQIKDIKVEYVLKNLKKFQDPSKTDKKETLKKDTKIVEENLTLIDIPEVIEKVNPIVEEIIDYESIIWISKGSEEKKIKLKLLKSHEMLGWNRIQ